MDIRTREEKGRKIPPDQDREIPESPSVAAYLDPLRQLEQEDYFLGNGAGQSKNNPADLHTQGQNVSSVSVNEIRGSNGRQNIDSKDWGRSQATFGTQANLMRGSTNHISHGSPYVTPIPGDIPRKLERPLPSALPYETSQNRHGQSANNQLQYSSSLPSNDNFHGYPGESSGPVLPKAGFSGYNRHSNFPSTIPDSDTSYQELTPVYRTSNIYSSPPGLPANGYVRSSEADIGDLKSSSPVISTPRPRKMSRNTIPNSSPTSPKPAFHNNIPMKHIVNPLQKPEVSSYKSAHATEYVIQGTTRLRTNAREKIMDTGSGNQILQHHHNNELSSDNDMSTQTRKLEHELEYDTPEDYYQAMLHALPKKKNVAVVCSNKIPVNLSSPRGYGTTLDSLGNGTEPSKILPSHSYQDPRRPFDHRDKRRKITVGPQNLIMSRDLNPETLDRTNAKQKHHAENVSLHGKRHEFSSAGGHGSAKIQSLRHEVIRPGVRDAVRQIRGGRSPSPPKHSTARLGNNPMLLSTPSSDSVESTTSLNFSRLSKINTPAPSNIFISATSNFTSPPKPQRQRLVNKPASIRSRDGTKMKSKNAAKPASGATSSCPKTTVESDDEYVPKGRKKDVAVAVKKEESQISSHPSSKHNNNNITPQGDKSEDLAKTPEHEDTSENEEYVPGQPLDIDYIPRQFWAELGLDPAMSEGYQDPADTTQPQSSKSKKPAVSPLEKFNEDLRSREAAGPSAPVKQLASPFAPNPFATLTKPTLPATNSNPLLAAYEYTLNNPVSKRTLADDDPLFSGMKVPVKRKPVYGKVDIGLDGKIIKKEDKEATIEAQKTLVQTAESSGTPHPDGTKGKGKEREDVEMKSVTSATSAGSNTSRVSNAKGKEKEDDGAKTAENTSGKPVTPRKRVKKHDGENAVGAEKGSGKKKAGEDEWFEVDGVASEISSPRKWERSDWRGKYDDGHEPDGARDGENMAMSGAT